MMDDDLEQLLKGLKLRRLAEILANELASAEEHGPSYTEFLRRLLRQEYTAQQDRFLEYRIGVNERPVLRPGHQSRAGYMRVPADLAR